MRVVRASSAAVVAAGIVVAAASAAYSTNISAAPGAPTSTGPSSTTTTLVAPPGVRGAGMPLYEFTNAGTGAPSWVARPLSSLTRGTTMSAGPRSVENAMGDVIAFATSKSHVAFVTLPSTGAGSFTDLGAALSLPPAADAPVPFFDGYGRLNLAYVTANSHVMLLTNDTAGIPGAFGRGAQFLRHGWLTHDLTTASVSTTFSGGVIAAGQLDARARGTYDELVLRTSTNQLVQLTVSAKRPLVVSAVGVIAPNVVGNPIYVGELADGVVTVAATTSAGHLIVYRQGTSTWTPNDLTSVLKSPPITASVAGTINATKSTQLLAGISQANGSVLLYSGTLVKGTLTWSAQNLTTATATNSEPGPALAGQLSIVTTSTSIVVGGRAADWGNLFDYANTGTAGAWVVTDVSTAGGVNATTVGQQVAAVDPGNAVNFFAGGIASPAQPGVGIYDIPYPDLPHAISDGWPILGITGGLGTTSAPWVQTRAASAVATSPDYVIGQTIQNSHKRTTWLSFWTLSGPQSTETASPATFQAHAFAAGAAIANQIDQYAHNGLNLKPDWVILDPEGYPDLHSQLDGLDIASIVGNGANVTVTTSSATSLVTGNTVALEYTGVSGLNVANVPIKVLTSRTFSFPSTVHVNLLGTGRVVDTTLQHAIWNSLLTGWRAGLASVDPSLNPGVYVDESEYVSESLANQTMPVFMAVAWYNGPPTPIAHSSNVLGYIEFGNLCVSGLVQRQLSMFAQPAFNGQYNTVQFNPPGYCTPTTP